MDKQKIFITIASVVGIFAFLIATYYATNAGGGPKLEEQVVEELKTVSATDHTKWSKSKKHVLVEFSDLQCPACASFHPIIEELGKKKEIADNITFVYKHFPLLVAHPYANDAAYAAEAAAVQGKFYEMVDLLFSNQATWAESENPKAEIRKLAEQLKLDMEKYDADVASDAVKKRVAADAQLGNKIGVDSTPTFYLDGQRVTVSNFAEFETLLLETAKK